MSTRREPPRLAAASDPLAVAIAALRSEPPNAAQLDAVARRLAPQLATPVLAGSASFALAWWAKWLLGLSLSLAIGAYVAMRGARTEPQPRSHSIAAPAAVAPRPETRPSPEVGAVQTRAPDEPPATRVRTPARRTAARVIDAVPVTAPSPERELAVLERSRAALDNDPAAALELTEAHARDYPNGIFAQERELLAIEALLKLKRKPEARVRAAHFVEHYPESPNARRVRALLDRTPDFRGVDPAATPDTEQH